MKALTKLAMLFLIIGGFVLGYEGLTDKDLIEILVGQNTQLELIIDSIFGVSAIVAVIGFASCCKKSK